MDRVRSSAGGLVVYRSTIARKVLTGEIQAVEVGNSHRVPYSEFQRFRDAMLDAMTRGSVSDVEADLFGDH